ncbi:DUF4123 domain-containing protein [Paraburkholderia bannensis]|uniref:DUF4123 domain-containing protein n=1 Tax=Paraburkholderia bannensis TaxID=765414 RepID=UPI002AB5E189|nr:DUF4123 domain-containing protein [Paraburkholderia bannensis]
MERIELHPRLLEKCSYAVIDPVLVDATSWQHLPVQSLAPPAHAGLASQLPWVLPLRELGADERSGLFAEVFERTSAGQPPLFCLLIESAQTPGSVIRHLARMMVVHAPEDRKPYQLRYHDAHTLMQLAWILNADQQKTLLGPATAWTFPLEQWWCLRPDETATAMPGLRLEAGQWQQLQRVGTINVALARQDAPVEQRAALGRQLYPWLVTAATVGLTDEDDVIAFATQGTARHPGFYRHPDIARILAQCEGQPKRYGRLTAALTETDWQRIAADMSSLST